MRHLTDVEGERLQGMPDHHTNIMWIGKRIDFVDGILNDSCS